MSFEGIVLFDTVPRWTESAFFNWYIVSSLSMCFWEKPELEKKKNETKFNEIDQTFNVI